MENKDFLNIFIFSDPHGGLPKIESPFDLLLIGGDVSPAHDHYYSFQKEWFMTDFADWINSLPFNPDPLFEPFSKVVMIGGNHDCFLERITKHEIAEFNKKTGNRVVILKNEEYDWEYIDDNGINSLKIFGTPYCKIFGNWSFMVNNDKLKEKYSKMPYNCDILLSHDAPPSPGWAAWKAPRRLLPPAPVPPGFPRMLRLPCLPWKASRRMRPARARCCPPLWLWSGRWLRRSLTSRPS